MYLYSLYACDVVRSHTVDRVVTTRYAGLHSIHRLIARECLNLASYLFKYAQGECSKSSVIFWADTG